MVGKRKTYQKFTENSGEKKGKAKKKKNRPDRLREGEATTGARNDRLKEFPIDKGPFSMEKSMPKRNDNAVKKQYASGGGRQPWGSEGRGGNKRTGFLPELEAQTGNTSSGKKKKKGREVWWAGGP